MQPYNKAFFRTHELWFLELRDSFGEETAISYMRDVMRKSLREAYGAMGIVEGKFKPGDSKEFVRVVKERDDSVGLDVRFPVVINKKIIYQFYTDPFPGLKGEVDPVKLGSTYMDFKVGFLLGEGWSWKMTRHIWKGADCIEYVIEKK